MSTEHDHPGPSPRRPPRCGACRAPLPDQTTWQCPACKADLHSAGIVTRRPLTEHVRQSIYVLACKLSRRPLGDPLCGKCRYPVQGLSELTCPECGSPLLTVGADRPRFTAGAVLIVATLLLAWSVLVFGFLNGAAREFGPRYVPRMYQASFTGQIKLGEDLYQGGTREQHDILDMTIDGQLDGAFWPQDGVPVPIVDVIVEPGVMRFRFDPVADRFTLHETPKVGEAKLLAEGPVSAIDEELVNDLIRRVGAEPKKPETRKQAGWIADALRQVTARERQMRPNTFGAQGTSTNFNSSHGSVDLDRNFTYQYRGGAPVGWFSPTVTVSVILIWLLGLLLVGWLLGRRRRG